MTSPSPQQLAAIAAAYAILRAGTPQAEPEPATRSRWALASRTETIADAPRTANVGSRWALAGRRDG